MLTIFKSDVSTFSVESSVLELIIFTICILDCSEVEVWAVFFLMASLPTLVVLHGLNQSGLCRNTSPLVYICHVGMEDRPLGNRA